MSFGDDGRRAWGSARNTGSATQAKPNGNTDYLKLNDEIASNIMKIQKNTDAIAKINGLIGTNKDTSELRERLHDVMESTRKLAKDTGEDVKKIATIEPPSHIDPKQRKQQQQKLNQQFMQTWQKFSDIAKTVIEKERVTVSLAKHAPHPTAVDDNHFNNPLLRDKDDDEDYEKQSFLAEDNKKNQQQMLHNELDFNDNIIAEREEGIREIESTINEVNIIFRDLAELVNDQGQMMDNVENNVSQTVVRTDQANQELNKASGYQKSARTKMCCLLLIILIVAAVLAIIFIPKS